MNFYLLIPVIAYFVVLVGYNYIVRRRTAEQGENVMAAYNLPTKRDLTPLALAMTSASTYASASSFIGGPGSAYFYGLGWIVIAMIQVPTMWFAFSVLGKRINAFASQHGCTTVNEVLYARYGSKKLITLTSALLVLCFIASIVVQFIGAARLLQGAVGIPYHTSLLTFVVIVALYTVFGNFKSVAYSDILQGTIMFVGSILLLYFVLKATGGVDAALTKIATVDPNLLQPFNGPITWHLLVSFWVLVGLGVVGLPQTIIRTMANENPAARNRAVLIATVVLVTILLAMHLAGFFGNAIIERGTLKSPDLVVPTLITKVMTPTLAAIFMLAPLAAIISTIDSQLVQTTSTIVNDLYLGSLAPAKAQALRSNLKLRKWIRFTTLAVVVVALISAFNPPQILIWLNILAFGGLQATFLWPVVLGLFYPRLTSQAALWSVVVGVVTYAFYTFSGLKFMGFHQIVPALLFSFIACWVVHFWTRQTCTPTPP